MDASLVPAERLANEHRQPWPGESDDYAAARAALLREEIELRRHLERVAEQRRHLPPGPAIFKNYRFLDENGSEVGLAELFGQHDTLISYSWMYGPDRARPCPMCTNFLGPLDQNARDIEEKAALVVVGRSTVERQKAFAQERGWRHLRFVQAKDDAFPHDFRSLVPAWDGSGEEWEVPSLVVFRKDGDQVRLFWSGEFNMDMADPGQDPRGAPDMAPLWNMLDITPAGRGSEWYPKLSYAD
ncbi:DUF899 domain-containing protein [Sphingomonas ginkgonis]|uniref:DUF899 domain-containing protein n=1 Tax=Sphingomonas ginkgonis TaxID=2315330 RepID=A0A3R9YJ35_9SPHN|nr:DUF899 family protein [Sphingomonas ginkgonis]RST31060.1 DUF899 domain-containing protein [Sphingomonas ginkgonis]